MVLGVAPFVKYLYAPLGAGDRFSFVSSIGGALVWAGLLHLAWQRRRGLALAAAVVLCALASVARVDRARVWTDAGADALAIQHGVTVAIPEPTGVVVVGPTPIVRDNVAAYLDQSNIDAALQLDYDDDTLSFGLTFSAEDFERYRAERRFDLRSVSRLEPS